MLSTFLHAATALAAATAHHIADASTDAGIDVGLPSAVKAHYDRAIASGTRRRQLDEPDRND